MESYLEIMIGMTDEAMQLRLDFDDEMVEMNNFRVIDWLSRVLPIELLRMQAELPFAHILQRMSGRALDCLLDGETMKAGVLLSRYYFEKILQVRGTVFR